MNKPKQQGSIYTLTASQETVIKSITETASHRYGILSDWDKNKVIYPSNETDVKVAYLKTLDLLKHDFTEFLSDDWDEKTYQNGQGKKLIGYLVDMVDWESIIKDLYSSVSFNLVELTYSDHKRTAWGYADVDLFIINPEMSANIDKRKFNHVPLPEWYIIGYCESSQQLLQMYLTHTHPIGLIKALTSGNQEYSEHDPMDLCNLIMRLKSHLHKSEWETVILQKEPIGVIEHMEF